jgi:ABC-type phosphate transport system substrate-binding protein
MSLLRALLVALLLEPVTAAAADVAVVVNPANPQSETSEVELVRIFRLDRQHWPGGGRIYLVLREAGAPTKEIVLRRLYRMNNLELKQFWLGKLYSGAIASFPRIAPSDAAVMQIVSQAPNAIGFVDATNVDDSVKVLRIGGRLPGESGYLLSSVED